MAWQVVKIEEPTNDLIGFVRLRDEHDLRSRYRGYDVAVVATWKFNCLKGLPDEDVQVEQEEFEVAIEPLLGGEEDSVLVEVSTGFGEKRWLFYCKSADVFMRTFNELLKSHPRYPVFLEHATDPDWSLREDKFSLISGL